MNTELDIDPSFIDKSLPVPVGRQLYGLMSYQLSHFDLPKGTKLPSVRRLASTLGIAQVTVAQVYAELRDAGLVEMRKGSGAYTRLALPQESDHGVTALRTDIDLLLSKAERKGVSPMSLVAMVNAQAQLRRSRPGLSVIFVGVFPGPGEDYVRELSPLLSPRDRISLVTLDQLRMEEETRRACVEADVVVTFVHRETEVEHLVPDANVYGLRFIPSDATRAALARLDPRARVAAITQLQDYIAIMKPSVQRYAPHVSDIRVSWSQAPDLDALIAGSDAVIYASGADHVLRRVRPGVPCFEYRHSADPAALEAEFLPYLAELRERQKAALKLVSGGPTSSDN
ncbi:GntR family transcriptional regulator [Pseudoroseicyclus tamaricis]|uniref:GntR family transcriptional regulator n=1 Tax=Pseudoroseicyclus tamaricis TaxID=2705421 RepID=A0A6B2JT25_9RHOB|nr:GntR family transcriptional regulator [Pseudoroseicyclus tamaricis]NDV01170.1 GntR family transcriptional regulator [Pseudoroseicyclus tamaricis]